MFSNSFHLAVQLILSSFWRPISQKHLDTAHGGRREFYLQGKIQSNFSALVLWSDTLKECETCLQAENAPTASKAVPSCLWEAPADYNNFPDDLRWSFFSPERFQELSHLKFFPQDSLLSSSTDAISRLQAKGQPVMDSERWMRGQAPFRCNPSYQQHVSASLLPLRPEVIHGHLDHLKESLTRLSFTFSHLFLP